MIYRDVSLAEIIERSVESVEGFAEQQGIKINSQSKPITVLADSDRLVQVLVNFLSNAIKFSNDGGEIQITVEDKGETCEVQVKDHGSGIPEGYEEKIFAKYEQVQVPAAGGKKRPGTGLGLPICKAIVEQHGGEVGVRKTEGGGSTFWFSVPKVGAAV